MITSEQQPLFTQNDPLAIQFLSRGGMGYMPQAQFLTPSEYGAFRTMPAARTNDFLNQDPGILQSYLIRSRGSIFGLPEYTFNTYNPVANQQLYMSQIRRSSYDQLAAMGASSASIAASMALTAPFGLLPGLAMGMIMPDMAAPFVNRVRDTRAMQNATMSRIVGGPQMNAVTGMGFNAAAAHDIGRGMRVSAAEDVLFKQGDYQKLMQLGIEAGMFDYASTSAQYKDTLKKLRNSMTTFMEVVGSTDFKDIMHDMKRLQTMGASASQFMGIARAENMFARMAGMNHADMVNTYGQQGALIYAQAGLNNYQGSLQAMSNAASVSMAQRMGILRPSEVARFGGVSGMAQTITQQDASASSRIRELLLSYLVNDSMDGLDPNADLMDLLSSPNPLQRMSSRAGRLNSMEKMTTFQANAAQLYGDVIDKYGQDNVIGVVAHAMGRASGIVDDPRMAMQSGLQMLGYDPEMARQKSTMMFNEDFQAQRQREARIHRQKMYEEHSLAQNPFRRFGRWIDTSITKVFENTFGEAARSYTNWQEKRDAEESGIVYAPHTGVEYSGADIARRLRASSALSENMGTDNVWSGTVTAPEEFRKRISGGVYGEHGGNGMDAVSFLVGKNGVPTTRGRDSGGSSFGELQFTTQNTLAFIRGDAYLKQRFKDAGFDVDADAAAVENTRQAIRFGNYNAASREDWAALERLQKAWGEVNKSEGFESKYFTYGRNLNWNSGFMRTEGNEAFKNSEAWRRVLFPIANHAGGGGLSAVLNEATNGRNVEEMMATAEGRKALLDSIYTTFTKKHGSFGGRYALGGEQYQWSLAQLEGLAPENKQERTYFQREQEAAAKRAELVVSRVIASNGRSGMDLNYAVGKARSDSYSIENSFDGLRAYFSNAGFNDSDIEAILENADVASAKSSSDVQDALRRSLYKKMGNGVLGEAKGMELLNNNPHLMRDLMAAKYAKGSKEERTAMEKAASEYVVRLEQYKQEYTSGRTEGSNAKADMFLFNALSKDERDSLRIMAGKDPDKMLRLPRLQEMLRSLSDIKDEGSRAEYRNRIITAAKATGLSDEAVAKVLEQGSIRVSDIEALGISREDAEKLISYGNKMYDGSLFIRSEGNILAREKKLDAVGFGAGDDFMKDYLGDQLTRHAIEQKETLLRYGVKNFEELRKPDVLSRIQKDIDKFGSAEEKKWIRDVASGKNALEASVNLTPLKAGAAADSRSGAVAGSGAFEEMWAAMGKGAQAARKASDDALKELPGVLTNLNTTLTNMDSTLKRLDKNAPSEKKSGWNPFGA